MKILLLGDTHGNRGWLEKTVYREVGEHDIDVVLSVGDFGYFPGWNTGTEFINTVSDLASNMGVPLFFTPGNHEDHDAIGGAIDSIDFVELKPNLYVIPHGHRWVWGTTSFVSLGGAWSIDHSYRVEGISLFAHKEQPNQYQINRAIVAADDFGNGTDILISHDCTRAAFDAMYGGAAVLGGSETREAIEQVIAAGKIKLNVSGHHHFGFTRSIGPTDNYPMMPRYEALGLDCEHSNQNMAILNADFDTDDPNWVEGFITPKSKF